MPRHRRARARRWENPVSPLQAARYERRWDQLEVCRRIHDLCPGHRPGMPCRVEPPKLSDWEHGRRLPNMTHVIILSRIYDRTPEELGLLERSGIAFPDRPDANAADSSSGTDLTQPRYATPEQASEPPEGGDQGSPGDGWCSDLMPALLLRALLGEGGSEQMRRDQFIKGIGAAAGAAAIDPFVFLSQQAQAEINHTRVSKEQVEHLTAATYQYAREFFQLAEGDRLHGLLSDWAGSQRLLNLPATLSQRRELFNVYARLSSILGTLALGQLQEHRARALFETAVDAARESGDAELVAWVYGRLSDVSDLGRQGSPQKSLELANIGLQTLGASTTLTAANLHNRLARAYGSLGDGRAALTHMEVAGRIFGNATVGCWPADPKMPRSFRPTEDGLMRTTSTVHFRLGDYAATIDYCRQAVALYRGLGFSPRTFTPMASDLLRNAEALLRSGEVEGATEMATVVVRVYDGVALPRILRRARRFERELTAAAPGSRYAQEFGELVRSRAA